MSPFQVQARSDVLSRERCQEAHHATRGDRGVIARLVSGVEPGAGGDPGPGGNGAGGAGRVVGEGHGDRNVARRLDGGPCWLDETGPIGRERVVGKR